MVKLSVYMPLRLQEVGVPRISRVFTWRWQGFQPLAPTDFTPQAICLVHISVRGWVDPRVTVWMEGSSWRKCDPSWNLSITFQVVVHCLNQLQEYNQITQILCVVFKHYNVLCNTGGRKMKTCSKNEDDEVCLGYTVSKDCSIFIFRIKYFKNCLNLNIMLRFSEVSAFLY